MVWHNFSVGLRKQKLSQQLNVTFCVRVKVKPSLLGARAVVLEGTNS